MAYQVLARKYRPLRFADVVGQDHVTRTLQNAITQGRIAHGYVFSGHRGIGKTTIARILASALNCRNEIGSDLRPTAEPCLQCDSCIEIRQGNSVDVLEIDAATNRGIDEIRELRDAARYRPARDKFKIIILDEAHQITDAAFNALLKTLEEPPDHIVFMMATTEPENIPQTIRSRCQHFSFHAVKFDDILAQLALISKEENVDANDAALALLAEAGDGSMRDALSIMDQAIASAPVSDNRPVLDAAQIRDLMGSVPNTVYEEILEAVSSNDAATVLTIAARLLDAGNSPQQIARQFVRYLRNTVVAKVANLTPGNAQSDLLQISPEERNRAARSAMLFTEEELTRFLQMMLRTFDDLGFRQEQRFHLELGLLKLVHLQRLIPMEELLSAFPSTAKSAPRAAVPQKKTPDAPPAASVAPKPARVATFTPAPAPPAPASSPAPAPPAPASSPAPIAPPVPVAASGSSTQSPIPHEVPSFRPERSEVEKPAVTIAEPATQQASTPTLTEEPSEDPEAQPSSDITGAGALQAAVVEALFAAKGQTNAAEKLDDAEWTITGNELRIQTDLSPAMLKMLLRPETDAIIKSTLREKDASYKLNVLPVDKTKAPVEKVAKPARAGSVQSLAMEHPIVQHAQKLFSAEITSVKDLRK